MVENGGGQHRDLFLSLRERAKELDCLYRIEELLKLCRVHPSCGLPSCEDDFEMLVEAFSLACVVCTEEACGIVNN